MALGDNEAARFSVWFRVHFGHQRMTRLCRRMTQSGHWRVRCSVSVEPCPDHSNAMWIVTVSGEIMASVPPGDVRPFKCETTLDKKLYVAYAAPAPFERTPLSLTCKR
jgi:hypothetical protein